MSVHGKSIMNNWVSFIKAYPLQDGNWKHANIFSGLFARKITYLTREGGWNRQNIFKNAGLLTFAEVSCGRQLLPKRELDGVLGVTSSQLEYDFLSSLYTNLCNLYGNASRPKRISCFIAGGKGGKRYGKYLERKIDPQQRLLNDQVANNLIGSFGLDWSMVEWKTFSSWHLKRISNETALFMYRLYNNKLLTRNRISHFDDSVTRNCLNCSGEVENYNHVFSNCVVVNQLYTISGLLGTSNLDRRKLIFTYSKRDEWFLSIIILKTAWRARHILNPQRDQLATMLGEELLKNNIVFKSELLHNTILSLDV